VTIYIKENEHAAESLVMRIRVISFQDKLYIEHRPIFARISGANSKLRS